MKKGTHVLLAVLFLVMYIGGSAAVPRYCSFRSHPGYCEFGIKRFYWDRRSGKCRQFHYNGRFGNANRFDTLAECRSACDVRRSYDKYV
ncbi:kunitz-type serine protease inhibitor dendrotoxin DaE1-like isoform X2 [Amblyomma americanum]